MPFNSTGFLYAVVFTAFGHYLGRTQWDIPSERNKALFWICSYGLIYAVGLMLARKLKRLQGL